MRCDDCLTSASVAEVGDDRVAGIPLLDVQECQGARTAVPSAPGWMTPLGEAYFSPMGKLLCNQELGGRKEAEKDLAA